jgi:hypothetical protein
VRNSNVKVKAVIIINIQQVAKEKSGECTIESMMVSFFEGDAMHGGSTGSRP